jgi:hypothetical protein
VADAEPLEGGTLRIAYDLHRRAHVVALLVGGSDRSERMNGVIARATFHHDGTPMIDAMTMRVDAGELRERPVEGALSLQIDDDEERWRADWGVLYRDGSVAMSRVDGSLAELSPPHPIARPLTIASFADGTFLATIDDTGAIRFIRAV